MEESQKLLCLLAFILVLGVGTHWMAWWARVPAILLLLLAGRLAGPVTGLLNPNELFGELFLPLVSLSVALILFEGGLNLRIRELKDTWRSLVGLLTVGAIVTWAASTLAAKILFDLPFPVALLLGAILVVTGPTVVGPLLREIRPNRRVSAVAKWEGIAIDPIGATLALLVFEAIDAIQRAEFSSATLNALVGLGMTALVGTVLGLAGAWLFIFLLRRFWIPDYLCNALALMFVITVFVLSNLAQAEAGLLAVTVMGITLSNQRQVDIRQIIEFKESLTILLIASLFILISASIPLYTLTRLGWQGPAFAAVLILIVRPISVWLATIGSGLSLQERCFLCWLAPRGIVAAAISSLFAARLGPAGEAIVPAVLIVIFITVATYGLTAGPLARWLGLSIQNPQGLLIGGANRAARAIAKVLSDNGFAVVLVDTNYEQIQRARSMGLNVCFANVLSEHVLDEVDFSHLGRFLGMTPNTEVNTMAAARFREFLGRANVYQLPAAEANHSRWDAQWQRHMAGQQLFSVELTFQRLESALAAGAEIKITRLSESFNFEAFQAHNKGRAIPLFLIEGERLIVLTAGGKIAPKPGQQIVSLVMQEPASQSTPSPEVSMAEVPLGIGD